MKLMNRMGRSLLLAGLCFGTTAQASFTTATDADITAAAISNANIHSISDTVVIISWNTDELADSLIEYGAAGGALQLRAGVLEQSKNHLLVLTQLNPGSNYQFQLSSADPAGNRSTSSVLDFTTAAQPDSTAPDLVSGPSVFNVTDTTASLSWVTGEHGSSQVNFGLNTDNLNGSQSVSGLRAAHDVYLNGLLPGATYFYQVITEDISGNKLITESGSFNTTGTSGDSDGDGLSDLYESLWGLNPSSASDASADLDSDGLSNTQEQSAGTEPNNPDTDGDGSNDSADALPLNGGESIDTDLDGIGNNADSDDDGDGVADVSDAFPLVAGESIDTDLDGIGNNTDTDDDGDSVLDVNDAFPLNSEESIDTDGDGIGNNADSDDDGDSVLDVNDAFPLNSDESIDTDGDDIGNNTDTDDDGDSVLDVNDAFPLNSEESIDTDGDSIGNNEDDDRDGDGLPNSFEEEHGLNDLDAGDASRDSDNDGVSNLEEYQLGLDPNQDDAAPVVTPPDVIVLDATGRLTSVSLGNASAIDVHDGSVPATTGDLGPFKSGTHQIRWLASDAAGNQGEAFQPVSINPLANLGPNQVVGEGQQVVVKVVLSGPSPLARVDIPYTVSGDAIFGVSHDLSGGVISFEAGELETELVFNTLDYGPVSGSDRRVTITLGMVEGVALGSHRATSITLTEDNYPPQVEVGVTVNGAFSPLGTIYQGSGEIELKADVSDPNGQDQHIFEWRIAGAGVLDSSDITNDDRFIFDPDSLPPGQYQLLLSVADNGLPQESTSLELPLSIRSTAPVLKASEDSDNDGVDDAEEGYGDTDGDGIANYQDSVNEKHLLPTRSDSQNDFLLETEPGLKLALGATARLATGLQSKISSSQLEDGLTAQSFSPAADTHNNVGGYYDFWIEGLSIAGDTVNVVIPLSEPIPAAAVYRKLIPGNGWQEFVVDEQNSIASARGETGSCPELGSDVYVDGLIEGYWCLKLSIEDGGPNDADGQANFMIKDPGGLATAAEEESAPISQPQNGGGGGGCSLSLGAPFDPTLPVLVAGSLAYLLRRRKSGKPCG
ncbi:MAG: JDVT-CTERM domain-containing protein [Motiliproteus sp.]